jgi:NAD(P)-dependent dehydrogenase (short-subunit alcohol dehydrogenase family)
VRNAARSQVVVITGATGGVGRAVVREYARRARGVALLARGRAGLEATAKEARTAGCEALPLEVDVADEEQVSDAADEVEERLGPIDVWVNAAFTSVFAPFSQIAPEEFRRVVEVDLLGFVHGCVRAIEERSCRWVRRWRTGESRCSRPTALPSAPFKVSTNRCGASCCTTAVVFG